MKKLLSFLLVATLVAALLAGCGSSSSDSSSDSDTFKIGGIGPTTGSASTYGTAVENGAQIAIDEINAAGGVNGYELEFNFQDDEADAEKSVNAYNTLTDWGMQILMGTVTSGSALAVVEETNADSIFQLTPSASSDDVIAYDNVFQVCFTDSNQGVASADYINDNDLADKVAVIYDSSDAYSTGIYEKFAEEAENCDFEIVAAESFTSDNKSDFSVQLQKAYAEGAELIFMPIYYSEASTILSQATDYDFTFFGCDGLDGILTVEGFDTSLAEGVMLLTPFAADAEDDLTTSFVAAYEEAYGETPNQFAADAYDAIYIIAAALEEAGVTPADDNETICLALEDAMTQITVDGLTGDAMTWSSTGEVNKDPKAVIIQDGTYVAAE